MESIIILKLTLMQQCISRGGRRFNVRIDKVVRANSMVFQMRIRAVTHAGDATGEGAARRRFFVGSRKVQCVSKFCVMVTHRRRSLMITHQVSVTRRRGFFLHNERGPFHS